MLAALVERDGGLVRNPGIVADDPEQIRTALADDVEVVLVSGGSSVGQEDHAPRVLAEDGQAVEYGQALAEIDPLELELVAEGEEGLA